MLAESRKVKRLPSWLKRGPGKNNKVIPLKRILRKEGLHTVCEEARCPNIEECFENNRATFVILGNNCTRTCSFCSVTSGRPAPPDHSEPSKVATAAQKMGAKHVVITSVTRDDLADGGAKHYGITIKAVKELIPDASVEVLTPDFKGNKDSISRVCESGPHVYNHNMETVASLYEKVRPQAEYERSLDLIRHVKENYPHIKTKSGLMLGFGENISEIRELLHDLKNAGCDVVTIGQYMRPSLKNIDVVEYVEPDIFKQLEAEARNIGFSGINSGPLVRSSLNAKHFYTRG